MTLFVIHFMLLMTFLMRKESMSMEMKNRRFLINGKLRNILAAQPMFQP